MSVVPMQIVRTLRKVDSGTSGFSDGERSSQNLGSPVFLSLSTSRSLLLIALGGGAFINKNIRDASSKNCVSFWLDLDAKTICQRIKVNMKRPLLNYNTTEHEIAKLYEARKKIYSLSDFRIDCNSKVKDKIIEEILKIYENI